MKDSLENLGDPEFGDPERGDSAIKDNEIGSTPSGFDIPGAKKDRLLIDRCLSGDAGAWDQLYDDHHRPLLSSVRVLLGGGKSDRNLIEEIASRVWYAVIQNDSRLLVQYDVRRNARLITFLRTVAKTEVSRHFRRENRRLIREQISLSEKPMYQIPDDAQAAAELREFLSTLTPTERNFYDHHLAERQSDDEDIDHEPQAIDTKPLSSNARTLRHRIREKLIKFMDIRLRE